MELRWSEMVLMLLCRPPDGTFRLLEFQLIEQFTETLAVFGQIDRIRRCADDDVLAEFFFQRAQRVGERWLRDVAGLRRPIGFVHMPVPIERDDDAYYYILDRIDDAISVGGELVHSMYRDGGFPEHQTVIDAVRARLAQTE